MKLALAEKKKLLQIARYAIEFPIKNGSRYKPDIDSLSENLKKNAATFVTLLDKGELRGCIGTLLARQSLAVDVANNAYNAAFEDSRFSRVTSAELANLQIQISILSVPVKIECKTEDELLKKMEKSGLILKEGRKQATFLPDVWEKLPQQKDFLNQLKLKAGLSENYWSKQLEFYMYTVEKISE